jgi:hypothetical protein
MKIIAHRGFWSAPGEKNTVVAFQRCIDEGFGIETDIRDYQGALVVSHDVPKPGQQLLSFDSFLEMYMQNKDKHAVLAINIKADGLHELLQGAIRKHNLQSYFVFDMSFPGLFFSYRKSGLTFYTSLNDYIQKPILHNEAAGIWLDAYEDTWFNMTDVELYLADGKKVCIVSPELHGREYESLWADIKESGVYRNENLQLCTDFPQQAAIYFF